MRKNVWRSELKAADQFKGQEIHVDADMAELEIDREDKKTFVTGRNGDGML